MRRGVPGITHQSLRARLPALLSAPDAAGANATAAGFGGLVVLALLWIAWAPPVLVGLVGAITLAFLAAGVVLPLLATPREGPYATPTSIGRA